MQEKLDNEFCLPENIFIVLGIYNFGVHIKMMSCNW